MKRLLLSLLMLPCLVSAKEPDGKDDPIDVAMAAAMEKESSTAGMVRAIGDAHEKWDKKLNVTYQLLKRKMGADEWKELVAAQKAWVAFRDAQLKSMDATFAQLQGTMWIPIRASMEKDLTKERAQFLEAVLHNISLR